MLDCSSLESQESLRDPDPLVADLLSSVTGAAIGSAVAFVCKELNDFRHQKKQERSPEHLISALRLLRDLVGDAVDATRGFKQMFGQNNLRVLGLAVLLSPKALDQYETYKSKMFHLINDVDNLRYELKVTTKDKQKLPQTIIDQIDFIEKRLKESRAAPTATKSYLNVDAALNACLGLIDDHLQEFKEG
jgi:hypothetical protein